MLLLVIVTYFLIIEAKKRQSLSCRVQFINSHEFSFFLFFQFFTRAAVEDEMKRKFDGRDPKKSGWNWWQLLLFRFFCFWCAFDLLLFPILFTVFSLRKERRSKRGKEPRSRRGEKSAGIVQPARNPRVHQLNILKQNESRNFTQASNTFSCLISW